MGEVGPESPASIGRAGGSANEFARRLFAGIAPEYERMGAVLSFGQDGRWRRFLASRLDVGPSSWVLDVATGTGLVAREVVSRTGCHVVGLDQSVPMIERGGARAAGAGLRVRPVFVAGQAERLPFPDEIFDGLTFTYLLRYVDDPAATLAELARVVRGGGVMAGLEFNVPDGLVTHASWLAYTRVAMPAVGWFVSPAWYRTGRFLGPSVSGFYRRMPLERQVRMWQEAGIREVRTRVMSLGGGVVTWGTKAGDG